LAARSSLVHLADKNIEGRTDIVDYVADNRPNARGWIGRNLDTENDLPRLRLWLTNDGIGLRLAEGFDRGFKLRDVFFGPFDLDPAAGGPIHYAEEGR